MYSMNAVLKKKNDNHWHSRYLIFNEFEYKKKKND